jgi:hypothetical protein
MILSNPEPIRFHTYLIRTYLFLNLSDTKPQPIGVGQHLCVTLMYPSPFNPEMTTNPSESPVAKSGTKQVNPTPLFPLPAHDGRHPS